MSAITLGIDVGGTKMAVGRWDGATLERIGYVPRPRDPEGMLLAVVETIERHRDGVAAVGVGIAGLVTWPEGRFVWGPNVPGRDLPIRDVLATRTRLPVLVDNDANVAAYGEAHHGAAQGHDPALMVTVGTGIGGGLVIDGRVYRGRSFAGEIGHVRIDPEGRPCTCGRRGCWETVASGRALDAVARSLGWEGGGRIVVERARQGDPAAQDACRAVGAWLGYGLADLVAVLDPAIVVLGGGLVEAADLILEPARAAMAAQVEGADVRPPTPLVVAAHGPWAGALGAAALAADAFGPAPGRAASRG